MGTVICVTGVGFAGKQNKACVYVPFLDQMCIRACVSMGFLLCLLCCSHLAFQKPKGLAEIDSLHRLLGAQLTSDLWDLNICKTVSGRVSPRRQKEKSGLYTSCCILLRGRTQRAAYRKSSWQFHLLSIRKQGLRQGAHRRTVVWFRLKVFGFDGIPVTIQPIGGIVI